MLLKDIIIQGFEYFLSIYDSSSLELYSPFQDLPHVAFFGASNAGKSSLISTLCKVKNLSFSSKTPGKTKDILTFTPKHSFFHKKSFIVDFPGYGYAKASNKTLKQWEIIPEFISSTNIEKSYILIPFQKELAENDVTMIDLLEHKQFAIVLTKCEKFSKNEIEERIKYIQSCLSKVPNFTRQVFITSTINQFGMQNQEIMQEIFDIFKMCIKKP